MKSSLGLSLDLRNNRDNRERMLIYQNTINLVYAGMLLVYFEFDFMKITLIF